MKKTLNTPLIKQAVLAKQANQRTSTSNTKTRGEVSGGGKKPWKQKGTGRARAGSSRSPIWTGGGVTFGPRSERNFKQRLPKKMNRLALAQLLNYLNELNQVITVPSLSLKEPKTKLVKELLKTHKINGRNCLFVTEEIEPELLLAANNLANVSVRQNKDLSVLDLANLPIVLMEEKVRKTRLAEQPEAKNKKITPKKVNP